jgi:hypothetical protein
MTTPLEPCPFCSGKAELREWEWPYKRFQVRCSQCKAHARARMALRELAIEAWNTRTIINALPDEEMVARALAEADGIREWDKLNKAGFAGSPRFVNKDYWFTQARAAISTLYKGVK